MHTKKEIFYKILLLNSVLFFLLIFSIQTISADVISLNSGGSTNLSVTPDKYVEGFFFGIEQEVNVTPPPPPPPPGGGGGGQPAEDIEVQPTELNIDIEINDRVERTIRVTNLGSTTVTLTISELGLTNIVLFGNTILTIPAGQTGELNVDFIAPSQPGIYTGKILIGSEEVLVTLNVRTEFLLFDSNIVVLNENYEVRQGDQLRTLVTLIPLGDPERLDVTLNFLIKDFRGGVYLTKSETLLVENQVDLRRNFDTGILPVGDYVIALELVYPNGVAPSSAHFKVTEKSVPSFLGRIILFLIIMIIIVLLVIIILILSRNRQKKQREIVEEIKES